MRIIDADALKKAITDATYNFEQIPIRFDKVQEIIDNAPTIERPQDKQINKIIEELESRKDYGVEYGQAMEDVIVILKAQFDMDKGEEE